MSKPLRIGVNALYLIPGGVGGTEVYLRNLLAAMAIHPRGHQFVVFVNHETGPGLAPVHPNFQVVETGVRAASRPRRILYEQLVLPRETRAARIDVLFNPGFTSPHLTRIPNATIIHDLQHHRHPEFFKWMDLQAWRLLVWASAQQSARILTVSDASAEDIHAVYNVPIANIHAAEPGVEPDFFTLSRAAEEPLILCVSTLHPHKNIERLVDAYAAFRARHPEYKLVLAGMRGFHGDAVERRIQLHGLEEHVRLTGWIPRAEIMDL
jgi:glycosyltransferase involved in cell wall biosynthesis